MVKTPKRPPSDEERAQNAPMPMPATPAQETAAEATDDTQEADAPTTLDALRLHLGLTAALTATTATLPTDALYIADEEHVRGAGAFATSYELVGMLHPPTVIAEPDPADLDGGRIRYRVVTGRRRVREARVKHVPEVECHVYDALTPAQEALLVLTENGRRSPSWAQELDALRRLRQTGAGMTIRQVSKATGIPFYSMRERMALAKLPDPIIDQALAGTLALATIKRIARLTPPQQRALAARAAAGETLSDETVRAALTAQFNQMAAPLHAQVADLDPQAPDMGEEEASAATKERTRKPKERAQETAAAQAAATYRLDLADMDDLLVGWQARTARWVQADPRHQKVALLTRALAQEIALLARQAGAVTTTTTSDVAHA